ncbi:MAG: hypothetical protein ACR2G0_11540 [Chthoniobacterales bacterium]
MRTPFRSALSRSLLHLPKTFKLRVTALTFLTSACFGFSVSAHAQGDGEPPAIASRATLVTVDYGNDVTFQPTKHSTDFDRLGVRAQQLLTLTVQFPAELVGQLIIAEPLDGGTLYAPEDGLFIDGDGNVTFQFQTGDAFGACRVAVHQLTDQNFIQFWIVDPDHPENTPPDLPGSY